MAIIKVIEVVGTSSKSWEDAAKNALKGASETVKNITGIEIKSWTARVSDGDITEYRATIKLAFRVKQD